VRQDKPGFGLLYDFSPPPGEEGFAAHFAECLEDRPSSRLRLL